MSNSTRATATIEVNSVSFFESVVSCFQDDVCFREIVITSKSRFETIEAAMVKAGIAANVTSAECTGSNHPLFPSNEYKVVYNKK